MREHGVVSVDVAVTAVIERPIDEVAAYVGDPMNIPQWGRRVDHAEWETDPPVRLGSRIRLRATVLGRSFEFTYEVSEYTPGEQVALRTRVGPFPVRTTYTWRPVGERVTHMVLRNESDPTGPASLASPLLAALMRREMVRDLDELERRLEHRA